LKRLGWTATDGETIDDQLSRPVILNAALYAENAGTILAAHELFEGQAGQLAELSADVRFLILRNEVQHFGNESLFDKLFAENRQSSDASYKADICAALTSTTDAKLIARLIEAFEDADIVKPQDLRAWYRGVLSNPAGEQAAWDWIRNDWTWLEKTVGGDMEFTTYITVTAGVFRTAKRLAEFKAFFEPKLNTPGLTREITMDTKVIESRVSLIEAEQVAVNAAVAKAVK